MNPSTGPRATRIERLPAPVRLSAGLDLSPYYENTRRAKTAAHTIAPAYVIGRDTIACPEWPAWIQEILG